jgi:hypothetical protein
MKTKLLTSIALLALLLGPMVNYAQEKEAPTAIKVIYFHGNVRCTTCNNMEKYTRELLEEDYASELKKGKLAFEVYNFDDESNAALVEKYKIESSTLLIVKSKNGKDKVTDLTEIGFTYAKYQEEKFKESVANKLNEVLR